MKFAGQWIELETIILSEVSQTQKGKRLHTFSCVDVAFESSDMCVSLYIHRGLKISKEPWVGGCAFKKEELEFGGIKC